MTNLDELRKHLTILSDEELLETAPDDLTEEARSAYEAEMQSRGLQWPAEGEEAESEVIDAAQAGIPLVSIAQYETIDEARYAQTLLRNEGIPVWIAGGVSPQTLKFDPSAPLDLVTQPDFLEQAQLVLTTEVSEEELARQAEEAGEAS